MRALSAGLVTELSKSIVSALIPLVEICAPSPIYHALHGANVSFGGHVYVATMGAFSEITEDTEGNRTGAALQLQNVDSGGVALPWSSYLQSVDLNGVQVKLHVYSSPADDAITIRRWYVSGWSIDREFVRIRLGSPHDALAFEVPTKPIIAPTCSWRYQGQACASTSALKTCDKGIEDCRKRFADGATLTIGPSWPFYSTATRKRRGS